MGNASFVSHSQLLRLLSEFGHRLLTGALARFLVLHQIGEPHPAVLAGAMKCQHPILEQLDEMGTGHVEQVRRLLGRQLCMDGHHLYCIAIGQLGQDVDQQA